MNSFYLVLIICGIAVLALLLNIRKKLPKYVFAFLSVAIIVSVSFYTMDFGKEEKDSSCEVIKGPFIFIEATKKISIASGKTKISLPTVISGKRSLDCIRMKFTSNGKSMTEQNFVEKMNFLLLFSEGTLLPATGIQFVREDSVKFPENFVLKAFFALPEKLSKSDCFLIVENKFSHAFSVSEVSVGSLPFSEK